MPCNYRNSSEGNKKVYLSPGNSAQPQAYAPAPMRRDPLASLLPVLQLLVVSAQETARLIPLFKTFLLLCQ